MFSEDGRTTGEKNHASDLLHFFDRDPLVVWENLHFCIMRFRFLGVMYFNRGDPWLTIPVGLCTTLSRM
jgi:hypothetical protein